MDKDSSKATKADNFSKSLTKTKTNSQYLASELAKMRMLSFSSSAMSVLSAFEIASEGVQKVKETIDPSYAHYEVLPKKIITADKINDIAALVSSRRDDGVRRDEKEMLDDQLYRLFETSERELKKCKKFFTI